MLKFDNSFQGGATQPSPANLSSIGSNNPPSKESTRLPPRVPILQLDKVKKVEPKKHTYQYIKKLEDSIKMITGKNKELEEENFELQEENRILLETNNTLYDYGEKAKVQIEKAHTKIKQLEERLNRVDPKRSARTLSERGPYVYLD